MLIVISRPKERRQTNQELELPCLVARLRLASSRAPVSHHLPKRNRWFSTLGLPRSRITALRQKYMTCEEAPWAGASIQICLCVSSPNLQFPNGRKVLSYPMRAMPCLPIVPCHKERLLLRLSCAIPLPNPGRPVNGNALPVSATFLRGSPSLHNTPNFRATVPLRKQVPISVTWSSSWVLSLLFWPRQDRRVGKSGTSHCGIEAEAGGTRDDPDDLRQEWPGVAWRGTRVGRRGASGPAEARSARHGRIEGLHRCPAASVVSKESEVDPGWRLCVYAC